MQNEGRMNEEWWRMNEGRMKNVEGWRINDEGWWFQVVEGVLITDRWKEKWTFVYVESLSWLKRTEKFTRRENITKNCRNDASKTYDT